MSDLQCPATVLLLTPETAAASDTREYRLALVVTRTDIPHGAALAKEIAELADLYRGEQVAIVTSSVAICEFLRLPAPPTAAVSIAVDSDGWRILSR